MGTGCVAVARTESDSSSVVVGKWSDGRIGSFRGLKQGHPTYVTTLYGTDGIGQCAGFGGYRPLVERICEFFITGKSPFDRTETIEMFAFMEAADESKRRGGQQVVLRDVLERAEQQSSIKSPAVQR
jgi:hypothetical protein